MGTWVDAPIAGSAWGRPSRGELAAALDHGFEKVFTDLRADNVASLAYHRALGFTVVGAAAARPAPRSATSTSSSSSGPLRRGDVLYVCATPIGNLG